MVFADLAEHRVGAWDAADGTLISDITTCMSNGNLIVSCARFRNDEHICRLEFNNAFLPTVGDIVRVRVSDVDSAIALLPYTSATGVSVTNKIVPAGQAANTWVTFTLTQAFIDDLVDQGAGTIAVRCTLDLNIEEARITEADATLTAPGGARRIFIID